MKGLVISFLPFAYAGHGNTNSNIISTAYVTRCCCPRISYALPRHHTRLRTTSR